MPASAPPNVIEVVTPLPLPTFLSANVPAVLLPNVTVSVPINLPSLAAVLLPTNTAPVITAASLPSYTFVVTAPLKELLEGRRDEIKKVWAIGPTIMMKFVSLTTQPFGVETIVSLNTIMIDGTGMCGGCRVPMTEGAKFVCVDGPEFNGHLVDWNGLLSRMQFYRGEEQLSVERWEHLRETPSHECNLEKAARGLEQ